MNGNLNDDFSLSSRLVHKIPEGCLTTQKSRHEERPQKTENKKKVKLKEQSFYATIAFIYFHIFVSISLHKH